MTDVELIEILESPRSNLEKALAIRAALKAAMPSALNIKPKTERKKREKRASPGIKGGIPGIEELHGTTHEEATP